MHALKRWLTLLCTYVRAFRVRLKSQCSHKCAHILKSITYQLIFHYYLGSGLNRNWWQMSLKINSQLQQKDLSPLVIKNWWNIKC